MPHTARLSVKAVIYVTLLALVLTAVGCGGAARSKSSGSATAPTPTAGKRQPPSPRSATAAWIARADAICGRLNASILARERVPRVSSREQLRAIEQVVPGTAKLERKTADRLEKLKPSASLANAWKQMIAYRRTLASELDRLVRATRAKDLAKIQALVASKKRTHGLLRDLAARNGFKDCAAVGPSRPGTKKRLPSSADGRTPT
jgi:hypothetical protein